MRADTLCIIINIPTLGYCGQGGYGELAGSCLNCGHIQCTGCNVEHHGNSSNTLAHTSTYDSYRPYSNSFGPTSISHHHDRASTSYSHPRQYPPGQTTYYWTCCVCGYDVNNVELNSGCSNNCGHWRNGCCPVRSVTLPRGRSMATST
jgi:hypothetical protein